MDLQKNFNEKSEKEANSNECISAKHQNVFMIIYKRYIKKKKILLWN